MSDPLLEQVLEVAAAAGRSAMEHYGGDGPIEYKEVDSPLTLADKAAHFVIVNSLQVLDPWLPVLSDLPGVGRLLFSHDWLVYVSLLLAGATAWALTRTRAGLVLRGRGTDELAAQRATGLPVLATMVSQRGMDEAVDLGHGSKLVAFDIGGAAGHQQAGIWIGAARAADRLTGLPHGFARDRTTVNHDEVAFLRQHRADLLAFGNVETASE